MARQVDVDGSPTVPKGLVDYVTAATEVTSQSVGPKSGVFAIPSAGIQIMSVSVILSLIHRGSSQQCLSSVLPTASLSLSLSPTLSVFHTLTLTLSLFLFSAVKEGVSRFLQGCS
jgi:hypothetical protein